MARRCADGLLFIQEQRKKAATEISKIKMKAFRPTPAGPREENAREPHPEAKIPVSNCKQTRAVTHSCELQERICFRTVTILNFFRKLFVQLIQYSYLCHSQTESIRHNGETRPARGCTVAENEQTRKTGYERPESFEYSRHYPAARRPSEITGERWRA